MKLSLRLERELKTLDALEDLGYTCRNLGDLYKVGHPYQDLEKALKLYQKAYDIFREADCRKQTTESMENVQICQECLADICFVAGIACLGFCGTVFDPSGAQTTLFGLARQIHEGGIIPDISMSVPVIWQQGLGSWLALFAPLLVSFGYIVTLSAALCLAASCSWQGTHYLGSC